MIIIAAILIILLIAYLLWTLFTTQAMLHDTEFKTEVNLSKNKRRLSIADARCVQSFSVVLDNTSRPGKIPSYDFINDSQLCKCKKDTKFVSGKYSAESAAWLVLQASTTANDLWEKVANGEIRYLVVDGGLLVKVWAHKDKSNGTPIRTLKGFKNSHIHLIISDVMAFRPYERGCKQARVIMPIPSSESWRHFYNRVLLSGERFSSHLWGF